MARFATSSLAAVAVTAMACTALGVGSASAQIPGTDDGAQTVVVDSGKVAILVNTTNPASGTVTGTVFNRTSTALSCRGLPNPDKADATSDRTPALAATRASTVAAAERYYAQFPFAYDQLITITPPSIPLMPKIADINIGLGSVQTMLPGSLAGMAWPDAGQRNEIAGAVTDARIAGQFGTIQDVNVPANGKFDFSVPLGQPTVSPRAGFTAGVFLACQISGRYHVFAGYEDGQRPAEPQGSLGTMFQTGVFGS